MELHVAAQKLFGFTLHRHVHRHLKDHFIPHAGNNHVPHVLHHRALGLYSVFLVLVKISVLAAPILLPYSTAQLSAITPDNIVLLTNQSRTDYGLSKLYENSKLTVAAQNKARDMMDEAYFAHYSPDGVSPWYWFAQAGYDYTFAGENLAIRFSTAEGVNEAWLASPAHRANILSKDFTEIGVGVVTDNFGKEGTATIVVQMFGAPQPAKPAAAPIPNQVQDSIPVSSKVTKAKVTPIEIAGANPKILFPLPDSFVNAAHFSIIGQASTAGAIEVLADGRVIGETWVDGALKFELTVPAAVSFSQGPHSLVARMKGKSATASPAIRFTLDTEAPEIFSDRFSITPRISAARTYDISAAVSEDSIRTIVSVGVQSATLSKRAPTQWSGDISITQPAPRQSLPIDLLAQDFAGNENRQRVGVLTEGSVRGVFNFISGSVAGENSRSFLGGLVQFDDYPKAVQQFYLYFVAFLAGALVLKIAIKRHIQHVRTVAAASTVMMMALVFFMF